MDSRRVARVEADPESPGHLVVRSPAVGIADNLPAPGVPLHAGQPIGWLTILGRRVAVHLPSDARGVVTERVV